MRRWIRAALCAVTGTCVLGAVGAGCLNRPVEPVEPVTTFINSQRATSQAVDKIDILLAIDNSASMSDKQKLLGVAVPDLVDRLVNPRCIDGDGNVASTPVGPKDVCPEGFDREFPQILDINVGVISSSLGDLNGGDCGGKLNPNDGGKLVTRGVADPSKTYQSKGFLAWDPGSTRSPPGIDDPNEFESTLTDLVTGVGEDGCGFEMQLESIYRFLVDPKPYTKLESGPVVNGIATKVRSGEDQELLDQRKLFLRPDSLVAVVLLSDENDCSVKVEGTGWAHLQGNNKRASSVCDANPGDKCCYNCGEAPPADCSPDAACANPNLDSSTGKDEDDANLRCWNQKRRYGYSALYPVARYVNAFTKPFIDPTSETLEVADPDKAVANPLFGEGRGADLVYVAGIVGVPWQAIAKKDANGPNLALGFEKVSTLKEQGFFGTHVGDPDAFKEPTEPLMIESVEKRPGVAESDPNGGDRVINAQKATGAGDLQYTCIYELADPDTSSSFCKTAPADNPLCENQVQTHAKAYPSLRELAVLGGMGDQGIPASICPANADPTDKSLPFGYGPAVATIVERLKEKLSPGCFNRKLKTDPSGGAACIVVEATTEVNGQADCDKLPGREFVPSDETAAIDAIKRDPSYPSTKWNSFCAIPQLTSKGPLEGVNPREQCQTVEQKDLPEDAGVDGWCYIDASSFPPIGNTELSDFDKCPSNEQRLVRFVGEGKPHANGTTFITCVGQASE